MFLEYRMRAFEGAFHVNYDYSHWYGWAPMKESLQKIRDEVDRATALKSSRPHGLQRDRGDKNERKGGR